MTCGIYRLIFEGTTKIYVGQSEYIEGRFTRHLREMRQRTSSIKLNEAYELFGPPTLDILSECSSRELDSFETETIEIFNSVKDGFNTYNAARGTSSICGQQHHNSKFSREQILEAFFLLLDPNNLIKDISRLTGIPIGSLNCLSRGASHSYLSEEYPKEYAELLSLVGKRIGLSNSAKQRGKIYPEIMSPTGEVYRVDNIAQFAKTHGIEMHGLCSVLNKRKNRKTVSGWTLKEYL